MIYDVIDESIKMDKLRIFRIELWHRPHHITLDHPPFSKTISILPILVVRISVGDERVPYLVGGRIQGHLQPVEPGVGSFPGRISTPT